MKNLFVVCALTLLTPATFAENIGSVSTKFKLIGPNDKIAVEVFDDPQIAGAACYLSRARTGGVSGAIGIAEDTSDASIACRQVGPINLPAKVRNAGLDGHEVFKQRTSLVFKSLQVMRFYDAKRNVLVYLGSLFMGFSLLAEINRILFKKPLSTVFVVIPSISSTGVVVPSKLIYGFSILPILCFESA